VLPNVAPAAAPTLRKYRNFLQKEYLPRPRETLGISAIPNGAACYAASLRRYTTLTISPKEIFNRGQNMVAESTAQVVAIGRRLYHTSDFTEIVAKVKADPANRFRSGQELFEYSRQLMDAAREKSKSLFLELPEQPVRIERLPTYLDSSGVPSHYEANATDAACYFLDRAKRLAQRDTRRRRNPPGA
jgi:uncharacterized protein (DUF885 family)